MRSLIIGIATLAMATVAATPAISASYESGYLGQAMAATGLIERDEMPTCRATDIGRRGRPNDIRHRSLQGNAPVWQGPGSLVLPQLTGAGFGPPLLLCERSVKVNKRLEKELEKVLD
jgi:hypothetical protein